MRRTIRLPLSAVAALLLAGPVAVPVQAAQQLNAYYYVNWALTAPGGNTGFEQVLEIPVKAPTTFWALSTTWSANPLSGLYLGLQTDGVRFDGSRGEMAIFSVWNATAARGPSCASFGFEGVGLSCRLPLAIATDRAYRLRLWREEADLLGQWWAVSVTDLTSGTVSYVGSIRAPIGMTSVGNPTNFTEYWGDSVPAPDLVPRSVVEWSPPGNGTGFATFTGTAKGDGTTGSHVVSGSGAATTVRVTMGGPA